MLDMIKTVWTTLCRWYGCCWHYLRYGEGLPLLALRLYLAPIMLQAGWNKFAGFGGTVRWFGNMGLPFPEVMAFMAATTELIGGALLVLGLMTRMIAVPLMVTMLVAAFLVHADNGWLAISDASSWLANERVMEADEKKQIIRDLVDEQPNARWLKSTGRVTLLNNGMEFAITYFCMLLVLFYFGGGRYFSLDYWITRWFPKKE